MHDQEKQKSVIYRLEQIRDRAPLICTPEEKYLKDLAIDTLDLLKEQKPRVMQFSEIMEIYNTDPYHVWPYNTPPYLYIQEHPHVRDSSESWAAWREIRDIIEGELFGHTAQSYGKTWRCWTTRPDEKVRAETAWQSDT